MTNVLIKILFFILKKNYNNIIDLTSYKIIRSKRYNNIL